MIKYLLHILNNIYYFFPVQLFINNLKKNQILLLFWFLLFGVIFNNFGIKLGIPYLFLDPEYLNEVSFRGTIIMGISFAIFTVSFFITSYILDSHKFAFLGTIHFPFVKFCINNSTIPLLFIGSYLFQYVRFQKAYSLKNDTHDIYIEALFFLIGFIVTICMFLVYFRYTNKSFLVGLAHNIDKKLRANKIHASSVMKDLYNAKKKRYTILYYLNTNLRIVPVDQTAAYDKITLLKVIDQHHLNAVSVELFVFLIIMMMGIFKDYAIFQIPAAASALLLFSFFIMFTGAFAYWLREWSLTGLGVLILFFNFLIQKEIIISNYEAFGLNYHTKKAIYSLNKIDSLSSLENFQADYEHTIKILENWKNKFPKDEKPKMVLTCFSGGGQRSATWTTTSLQHIDKETNGGLMKHTILMTGASGGLIGASYYRELYLLSKQNKLKDSITNPTYISKISTDVLNPMIFSMVVSDFFLRLQKFNIGEYEYYKGRGFAFEQQLNSNLNGILHKKVSDYAEAEANGDIPILLMSPTIINDGRKLFISAQPMAYMTTALNAEKLSLRNKGIELRRFLADQDADNLSLLSALRMNATFPYITPNVILPTEPKMEIMDAGLSDNFGISNASHFLYTFREWIIENTSGVVVLSIRDSEKNKPLKEKLTESVWNKIFNPIAGLFNNWSTTQDLNNDNSLKGLYSYFGDKLDVVTFEYKSLSKKRNAFDKGRPSLSWHLTTLEKETLKQGIYSENNKKALKRLKKLLQEKE